MEETARFLSAYVALPERSPLVMAAWVAAAWLADVWDRFPHLAITSPEKRCGKTTLLDLLALVVPRPRYTTNISPAALYRVIEKERPTLLMDESQSLARRGSEASEVIREILNAGIGRNAKVVRCGGERMDQIQEFSVYGPKAFAMIGEPDGVLADRSLPVPMKRKTRGDDVRRYRSRAVEPEGAALHAKLAEWAGAIREGAAEAYDTLEPFPIENDRMAELLLPLQAVLTAAGGGEALGILGEYAAGLDERDRRRETQTPGVMLLAACREIFHLPVVQSEMPTGVLLLALEERREEPWYRWDRGRPMGAEALANLLRPFGIRPRRNKAQTWRGYFAADFREAWERYLPHTPETPSTPSAPSRPSHPIPRRKPQ